MKNQNYRVNFKLESIDTNEQFISIDQICYFKGNPLHMQGIVIYPVFILKISILKIRSAIFYAAV